MDIPELAILAGRLGIIMLLLGIILLVSFGQALPISHYLFRPLNRDIIGRTKVFLQRYGILFALFFTGGAILVVAAAIMLFVIFQRSLLS